MNVARQRLWVLIALLGPLGPAGCAGGLTGQNVSPTEIIRPAAAPPEASLLDVGIKIFQPTKIDTQVAEEQGTHPGILEAEARYIPFHLKTTLQNTGQWGAVRVVPDRAEEMDVSVSGRILESSGEVLRVVVKVADATGRIWFDNEYVANATEKSYDTNGKKDGDPFQDLYNRVANDMLAFRQQLGERHFAAIRQVSLLKFAYSVAPQVYTGYIAKDGDGVFSVSRLPADNDPMFERVNRIRGRENMFIDTVNLYYNNLYDDMQQPYVQWRRSSLQELTQKRKLEREAWMRRMLGIAAVIGGAVVGSNSNSSGGAVARDLMIIGGIEAFRSGQQYANDAKVHEAALKELGASFKSDVAPIVEEVDGKTIKLSGSVDSQYVEWRRMLRELFAKETGLPPEALPPGKSPEVEVRQ